MCASPRVVLALALAGPRRCAETVGGAGAAGVAAAQRHHHRARRRRGRQDPQHAALPERRLLRPVLRRTRVTRSCTSPGGDGSPATSTSLATSPSSSTKTLSSSVQRTHHNGQLWHLCHLMARD